jgi:hypothetical protein
MRHLALAGLLVLSACSAPGTELAPEPGDFAFIEVTLKG